ncbi:MAG TPA: zinc ribbon domain-containing protein [Chthonomonadaceae bacterium]|nr:zinc ribbon domain-containing protein [Chthonomonadaceae bacterium]
MICPKCGTENSESSAKCVQCGEPLSRPKPGSDFDLSAADPPAAAPVQNPPPYPPQMQAPYPPPVAQPPYPMPPNQPPYAQPGQPVYPSYVQSGVNVVDTMIPANNPNALISYYLGIFSILPGLGIVMGIIAIILGVKGLKLAKEYPTVRGKTHAWVGIISGGFFALLWLLLTLFIIIAIILSPHGGG